MMDQATSRQKAWIGDAVLSLYARQWILREKGRMDGELHTRFTSNDFLATIGNPTGLEAQIGVIYEAEGLEAAFGWIERELMPTFRAQLRKSGR
jgi:dsRNA-specific ribonuclease